MRDVDAMRRAAAIVAMILAVGALPAAAQEASAPGPREAIQTVVDRVVVMLHDTSRADNGEAVRTSTARQSEIRRAAFTLFDFEEVSRRSLGQHWAARTATERAEFVKLFTDLLERTYIDKIETYLDGRISWGSETRDGTYATVRSRAVRPRSIQTVDYQVHLTNGRWKVYDLVVDGVSFISNYRSQFDRVISGSSYASLVAMLQRNSLWGEQALPRNAPR
jgi:phospholipid transport system substrate-binding protein